MGARRKGRSSVAVEGRHFYWDFNDNTGELHIVPADKKLVVRFDCGWPDGGLPATLVVVGQEFAGLPPRPRPVKLVLPTFDHCYGLKGWVKRVVEWSLWPDHPIVVGVEADTIAKRIVPLLGAKRRIPPLSPGAARIEEITDVHG